MPDLADVDEDGNENEPHDVPSEQRDASSEDPLRDHRISPPLSQGSGPSEQSPQPDEGPDDHVANDGEQYRNSDML